MPLHEQLDVLGVCVYVLGVCLGGKGGFLLHVAFLFLFFSVNTLSCIDDVRWYINKD